MNSGKYIFSQLTGFLPKRIFDGIVQKYQGDKYVKSFTCWNQLMVMMFGQLSSWDSLREVICIIDAIKTKSYHLGFGAGDIKLSNVAYANANRDYRIFEEFANYMINLAQRKRIDREFVLNGKFYAFDSTTIDLCLSLFQWANFRKTKACIKVHTLFDVVTQIPTYVHITEAKVHDVNATMDDIPYEPYAFYIFDKGYYDLARLYKINIINSFFVIRQKSRLNYEVIDGEDLLDGQDIVLLDQTIRLTGYQTKKKYPAVLRRIVYYAPDLKRTFTFLTNDFTLKAKDIALLYKERWQVELFFRWIKQHLKVTSFWGTTENAVRIQIYVAIIAYCLVAIVEHDAKLNRTTFNVLRVISRVLTDKTPLRDLFAGPETMEDVCENVVQLEFVFSC
ncbi:MAG: IS4 family transposase [Bacteroidales bacterium]|nr:IS4 family transposase [Bacteroidales bacterium]